MMFEVTGGSGWWCKVMSSGDCLLALVFYTIGLVDCD